MLIKISQIHQRLSKHFITFLECAVANLHNLYKCMGFCQRTQPWPAVQILSKPKQRRVILRAYGLKPLWDTHCFNSRTSTLCSRVLLLGFKNERSQIGKSHNLRFPPKSRGLCLCWGSAIDFIWKGIFWHLKKYYKD